MPTVDVEPQVLLDAARVLFSAVPPSWFGTKASPHVGARVSNACDDFVKRLERASMTKEIIGLAHALEAASGTYVGVDTAIAQKASGRGD